MGVKEFNLFVETISLEDMNDFRDYVANEHLLYLEHPDFYKDYIPAQYKPKEKSSTTIINTNESSLRFSPLVQEDGPYKQ